MVIFWVLEVFWSFLGFESILMFWRYFGHFLGFRGTLVIFWVLKVFWSFLGFKGILVIFWVSGVLWSFFGFRRYFGHFFLDFGGILVIF